MTALAVIAPLSLSALDLPEGTVITGSRTEVALSQPLPAGPFMGSETTFYEAKGAITHRAYKRDASELTSRALAQLVSEQYLAKGYREIYRCEARSCGGFDFRFLLDLLPEPQMHVNLSDFSYALLVDASKSRTVAYVASNARDATYLHVTEIAPSDGGAVELAPAQVAVTAPLPLDTGSQSSAADGRTILADLDFATGATSLSGDAYPSLDAIAASLTQDPNLSVVFVGHTDSVGDLQTNVSLSQARARAVLDFVVQEYGISPDRLDAQGVGYLAPIASNQTSDGRAQNRRVEAVFLRQ